MLAPTLGALCLIFDLHTPKRFYNMLRVVKATSPMSLGSWALVGFGGSSAVTAALQLAAERVHGRGWMRGLARIAQLPAALTGGLLASYTASLLSATSTPRWAVGGRSRAVQFAGASVASAAAAMSIGEDCDRRARDLDNIAIAALTVELAATLASDHAQRKAGIHHSPPTCDSGRYHIAAWPFLRVAAIAGLGTHGVSRCLAGRSERRTAHADRRSERRGQVGRATGYQYAVCTTRAICQAVMALARSAH